MKFQTLPVILSIFSVVTSAAVRSFPISHSPTCVTFEPIKMKGDAKFVDTGNASVRIGDMTIGDYTAVGSNVGVPELKYTAECVITSEGIDAPTCSYDFQMEFCFETEECRRGSFAAYGKGPGNIKITGGADDFFGAFGQIETPTPFNRGTVEKNSDLTGSTVEMRVRLCYYADIGIIYPRKQAVDYDLQKGIKDNGVQVYQFDGKDYLTYKNLNFGPSGTTKTIQLRYSKGQSNGGSVAFMIDGPEGTNVIGTYLPVGTGGWNKYSTVTITITDVVGIQDLTFRGRGAAGIMNFEWFELSA